MTLFMTSTDVEGLLRFAIYSAAFKLHVANAEWDDPELLLQGVQARSPETANAFRSFRDAYYKWFQFWSERESNRNLSLASQAEYADLAERIRARDKTRLDFVRALQSLPWQARARIANST
jgi:hypothetical protein